jgi:dTDP-4-amino-4,6-dideoxygalactose transaminase
VQISEDVELGRRKVFDLMREAGIGVNVHYIPVHTQPYYRAMGFRDDDFPVALSYYRQAISIPMYASLTIEQQSRVVEVMHEIFERD